MPDDAVRINCVNDECGTFVMDRPLRDRYKRTGETFHCPAGHAMSFTESVEQQLRERIAELEAAVERQKELIADYRENVHEWYDKHQAERDRVDALVGLLLDGVDGVVELLDGEWKWACECGSRTTTTFDTEREAWDAYDRHRENNSAHADTEETATV